MSDEQVAEDLRTSNLDFRELEEAHHQLDKELQKFLKYPVLTPEEEGLKKKMQKEKLGKKDRMAELMRIHRQALSKTFSA